MLNVDRVEEADPGSGGGISGAKIPPLHTEYANSGRVRPYCSRTY